MFDCDVVYIKGNPNSGTKINHEHINAAIIDFIKNYSYNIICSDEKNIKFMKEIPKARVYIGFSRGSRYLSKLDKDALKISIGGLKGSGIFQFINKNDKILTGDISKASMEAHFLITQEDNLLSMIF